MEHVVIGAPFGVLALDTSAKAVWLQLEPVDRLLELAEIAESHAWNVDVVQQVRSGKKNPSMLSSNAPLVAAKNQDCRTHLPWARTQRDCTPRCLMSMK